MSNLARVFQEHSRLALIPNLTIIVPTMNEAASIELLLTQLSSLYPGVRAIVVDDQSSDGTPDIVRRFASSRAQAEVRLISRPADAIKGITASVTEGIQQCRTEYFAVMDGDLQHPPEVIADLLEELRLGADIVVGCRLQLAEGLSPLRTMLSRAAGSIARLVLKRRNIFVRDPLSGLFAGRTDCFKSHAVSEPHRFEAGGYKVLFDLLKLLPPSAKIREVNYSFRARPEGDSKLRARHAFLFLRSLAR